MAIYGPVFNIVARTLSDFFMGHHYWTGIFSAVYVLFKKSTAFSVKELFDWRVLLALATSMLLHAMWNGSSCIYILVLPEIMQIFVCICSVTALIVLINVGIAQTRIMGIWETYRTDKEDESAERAQQAEASV